MPVPPRTPMIFLMLCFLVAGACISQTSSTPHGSPTFSLTTVKVGYLPVVSNGPLYIALDKGYFIRQGINLELVKVQNGASAVPSLINGDLDVAGTTVSPAFVNAVTHGSHIRIVADKGRNSPGLSCNVSGIMVRQDLFDSGAVTKVSDLKGRKITSAEGSEYKIYRFLKMGNLTQGDVQVVRMDMALGVVALKNGAADAIDTTEPYVSQLLNDKAAVMLVPTEESTPDFPTPLFYGAALLDNDQNLGGRFMVAYLQGVQEYNLGKTDGNIGIISNYTQLPRNLLQSSCWLPVARDGDIPRQPVREYIDWMYANDLITRDPADDELFDSGYVTYANGVLANVSGKE